MQANEQSIQWVQNAHLKLQQKVECEEMFDSSNQNKLLNIAFIILFSPQQIVCDVSCVDTVPAHAK